MNYQHLFCNLHIYHSFTGQTHCRSKWSVCGQWYKETLTLLSYPSFFCTSHLGFFPPRTSCDAISQKREARSWEQTSVVFTSCHMHKCFLPDSSHFLLQTDIALSLKNNQNGNMRLSGHEEKYIDFVAFGINCLLKYASSV